MHVYIITYIFKCFYHVKYLSLYGNLKKNKQNNVQDFGITIKSVNILVRRKLNKILAMYIIATYTYWLNSRNDKTRVKKKYIKM